MHPEVLSVFSSNNQKLWFYLIVSGDSLGGLMSLLGFPLNYYTVTDDAPTAPALSTPTGCQAISANPRAT